MGLLFISPDVAVFQGIDKYYVVWHDVGSVKEIPFGTAFRVWLPR